MSGIRERTNPATAAGGSSGIDLHAALTEHLDTTSSSDPNDSYELRDMIAVAKTYLQRGMVDDAEELLAEALAAGYSRDDARELQEAIQLERGQPAPGAPPAAAATVQAAQHGLPRFTQPLPGSERESAEVQRAIREADDDLSAGRLSSAVDSALRVIALAPDFYPIYVRLAELRLALGDTEGAAELVELIRQGVALRGDSDDSMILPIRVALDPTDLDALVQYARHLLAKPGTSRSDPYIAEAIERCIRVDPPSALDLATSYLESCPASDDVLRLYLRAAGVALDRKQAVDAVRRSVRHESEADLLFLRAAASWDEGFSTWLVWLGRAVARLSDHPDEWKPTQDVLPLAGQLMPERPAHLTVAIARVAMRQVAAVEEACARWADAVTSPPPDAREALLASCARALGLFGARQPAAIDALATAVAEAVVIDVQPFAETCSLFGTSIAPKALLDDLVALAKELGLQESAAVRVSQLRDRFPENLEIRSALAELNVSAGRVPEGVRELRHIAERYETLGDMPRMVQAMRRISDAIPTNAEAKTKLIEGYLQRGVLDEAVRELELLGELHVKRGKHTDAVAAFVRGAEIATAIGNPKKATELYDRAVAVEPDNVSVRHAAVAFYLQAGVVERAAQQLWEVVRVALRENDPDEAVAALHQIIGLTPTDANAYHRLGEVLSSLGEYAQAERVYRRLATLTPDDPVLAAKQSALAVLATGR